MRRNDGRALLLALALTCFCAISARADSTPERRSKNVRFEDSVVEGMNQNSKDSLDTVGKKDGAEKSHLYKKRETYKPEIGDLSKELGQLP